MLAKECCEKSAQYAQLHEGSSIFFATPVIESYTVSCYLLYLYDVGNVLLHIIKLYSLYGTSV